jgi:SpoVK/Ycf46/Vps4 family AAA+-type ATPase
VLLAEEELAPGFSFEELSGLAEGYSGSDLKALCVAAAYRPIRELLAQEAAARKLEEEGREGGGRREADKQAAGGEAEEEEQQQVQQAAAEQAAAEPVQQEGRGSGSAAAAAGAGSGADAAAAEAKSGKGGSGGGSGSGGGAVQLRPLRLSDFKAAMKQVGPSVAADTRVMEELKQWNERFGEGGNRRDGSTLTYFM